jgi:hypothetical protein
LVEQHDHHQSVHTLICECDLVIYSAVLYVYLEQSLPLFSFTANVCVLSHVRHISEFRLYKATTHKKQKLYPQRSIPYFSFIITSHLHILFCNYTCICFGKGGRSSYLISLCLALYSYAGTFYLNSHCLSICLSPFFLR